MTRSASSISPSRIIRQPKVCRLLVYLVAVAIVMMLPCSQGKIEIGTRRREHSRRNLSKQQLQMIQRARRHDGCGSPLSQEDRRTLLKQSIDTHHHDRILTVEGTETPMFLCDTEDTVCRKAALRQQDEILQQIQSEYKDARIVAQTYKLANALYVEFPSFESSSGDDDGTWTMRTVARMRGVQRVQPHQTYVTQLNVTSEYLGATAAQEQYCATGKGIKMAILDTGVDYTHEALGGPGTKVAYQRAYGRSYTDSRNVRRDGLFPTERVYEGYDFLGDRFDVDKVLYFDDDPVDSPNGHGTTVASSVLGVAPDVEILAVKVCANRALNGCPGMSIMRGMEYALDPNGDGKLDDKVDIINLSLGGAIFSGYYDAISVAIENAFELGVLTVVAQGNDGNVPYVVGGLGTTGNSLAIGATGHPGAENRSVVEHYSSRGPADHNYIKPDLSASARSLVAVPGTGNGYERISGTSYSTPLVAGAAALLKEKCRGCSPFAIKAILMNTADRNVRYDGSRDDIAPISLAGAGELRILDALEADFWVHSPDDGDVQPSLSLGIINAASDLTIKRTLTIKSMTNSLQTLRLDSSFRDPADEASEALSVAFPDGKMVTLQGCPSEVTISVEFHVNAVKAPNNHMSSGGDIGLDPTSLDKNEFDGWILIQSVDTGKEVGVPFLMLLRKAANVHVSSSELPGGFAGGSTTNLTIENRGVGVAQIDSYSLLDTSPDDPEADFGVSEHPGDLRAVGYRTLQVGEPGCSFLLEFAVTFFEKQEHLVPNFIDVDLDVTGDQRVDFVLLSGGKRKVDNKILNLETSQIQCTGFTVDHGTNTANSILRVCAEDVGLSGNIQKTIYASFWASAVPSTNFYTDFAGVYPVTVPASRLNANSYDIGPFEVLQDFVVTDSLSGNPARPPPAYKGIQLVTNAFRDANRTGAATADTETILLLRMGVSAPPELTTDVRLSYPNAQDRTGPTCEWRQDACLVPTFAPIATEEPTSGYTLEPTVTAAPSGPPFRVIKPLEGPACPTIPVPRGTVAPFVAVPIGPLVQEETTIIFPVEPLTATPATSGQSVDEASPHKTSHPTVSSAPPAGTLPPEMSKNPPSTTTTTSEGYRLYYCPSSVFLALLVTGSLVLLRPDAFL